MTRESDSTVKVQRGKRAVWAQEKRKKKRERRTTRSARDSTTSQRIPRRDKKSAVTESINDKDQNEAGRHCRPRWSLPLVALAVSELSLLMQLESILLFPRVSQFSIGPIVCCYHGGRLLACVRREREPH